MKNTLFLLSFIFICHGIFAQDSQGLLFKDVDEVLAKANSLNAVLLSPENYKKGFEEYSDAKASLKEGESLESIREQISKSKTYLAKAVEVSEMATNTFVELLDSRDDAKSVFANTESKDNWEKAEDLLKSCMSDFEDGDVQDAKETSREAEKLYRQAELDAIKNKYLGNARKLIQNAEEMDVMDNAPVTLAKANLLLQQSETELNSARYDNKNALNLVNQSAYEAKHAVFIDKLIREMREGEKSWEDLILYSEKPLQAITNKYKIVVGFENGYEQAQNEILKLISDKESEITKMKSENIEAQKKIGALNGRIDSLFAILNTLADENNILQVKVDAFEKEKREFQEVGDLFTLSEAEVFKDGNNIVIRLISLNFDAGKAIIDPQYFALLSKVQKAIEKFENCTVSIEGHTDSQGSDDKNLELSQERAEAVRQYLLANVNMNTTKLLAIGYGETKPVANNETEEGRKKNRRIDVVINPER